MVRQHLQLFHIGQRLQVASERQQLLPLEGDAGHDDMADPYRFTDFFKILRKGEDPRIAVPGQLLVLLVKHMLDIKEHQIGDRHQSIGFFGMIGVEQDPTGIQRRVDPVLLGFGKQLGEKIYLQHWLAAGGGDAAGGIEGTIAGDFFDDLIGSHLGAACHLPCIGIVAVQAPHGTALEKHNIADSGTVHSAKALKRMNASGKLRHCNHILSWKVREITSSCWARVSLMKLTA